MLRRARQAQTKASFDYQWRELFAGAGLPSDDPFMARAPDIVSRELMRLDRSWFRGRSVLDAGCGNGRWTIALLQLGASVTAVDSSSSALVQVERNVASMCTGDERARLAVGQVDLLDLPTELAERRFDLVFSFGVLHHTGDLRRALGNTASLVADDGVLFLYLYGRDSLHGRKRLILGAERFLFAPLPFETKRRLITRLHPWGDPHQLFDLFSPTINERVEWEDIVGPLHALGFEQVLRTIPDTELFLRAARRPVALARFELPEPEPPFWFQR